MKARKNLLQTLCLMGLALALVGGTGLAYPPSPPQTALAQGPGPTPPTSPFGQPAGPLLANVLAKAPNYSARLTDSPLPTVVLTPTLG